MDPPFGSTAMMQALYAKDNLSARPNRAASTRYQAPPRDATLWAPPARIAPRSPQAHTLPCGRLSPVDHLGTSMGWGASPVLAPPQKLASWPTQRGSAIMDEKYPKARTALLFIDPYNDFLSRFHRGGDRRRKPGVYQALRLTANGVTRPEHLLLSETRAFSKRDRKYSSIGFNPHRIFHAMEERLDEKEHWDDVYGRTPGRHWLCLNSILVRDPPVARGEIIHALGSVAS